VSVGQLLQNAGRLWCLAGEGGNGLVSEGEEVEPEPCFRGPRTLLPGSAINPVEEHRGQSPGPFKVAGVQTGQGRIKDKLGSRSVEAVCEGVILFDQLVHLSLKLHAIHSSAQI